MTDTPVEEATNELVFSVALVTPGVTDGMLRCVHGSVQGTNYVRRPRTIDGLGFQNSLVSNHRSRVGCDCPVRAPVLATTVTFSPPSAVPAGAVAAVPMLSAVLSNRDFTFASGVLTCARTSLYLLEGSLVLVGSVRQGATGFGHVWVTGVSIGSAALADVAQQATATVNTVIPLVVGDRLELAYQNTSASAQAVQTTTLKVSSIA